MTELEAKMLVSRQGDAIRQLLMLLESDCDCSLRSSGIHELACMKMSQLIISQAKELISG